MKRPNKETFKSILKRERMRHGWSQQELAKLINCGSFNTISRWERGISNPGPYYRQRLGELFAMSLEDLGILSENTGPFVFLSYAQDDELLVQGIKEDIESRGFAIWNDQEEQNIAGRHALSQQIINEVLAVVLIATPNTRYSPIVKEELVFAEKGGCPVLALWMVGKRRMDVLPSLQTAVRFINTIDARETCYEQAICDLEIALQAYLEKSSENVESVANQDPRNPYKGLRAFTCKDAGDFFGRDGLIDELADELDQILLREKDGDAARLLAVIGPSGSGKSSVVLAGLLPRLQMNELPGSKDWIYLPQMVPGEHPLEALALALERNIPCESLSSIREYLKDANAYGLSILTKQLVTQPEVKAVLVIDQFEELFTQTNDVQERTQFVSLLVTAITDCNRPLLILLTMRADFYGRATDYPALGKIIERQNKLVYPLTTYELQAAIEKPASLADVQLSFEDNLIDILLTDVQGQTGALPLLQFTLDQLFLARKGHLLSESAYHEIGGVKGALSAQAERTFQNLPSDEYRILARALFLRLIDIGTTEQDISRRRVNVSMFTISDSAQDLLMQETIEAFVKARLLTISQNTETNTITIEISHEALISNWERLSRWLHEHPIDIQLQENIGRDVVAWQQYGKRKDHLYRGVKLMEAEAWAMRNVPNSREVAFIRASATLRTHSHLVVLSVTLVVILLLLPLSLLIGSLFGVRSVLSSPILPGGWWISPARSGQTIHDILHLAAYAYPEIPIAPKIAYVNFTMRWHGGIWTTVCHLSLPSNKDIFQCDVNLRQLGATPGQISISFDVYDHMGTERKAPNGVHQIVYIPSS